ncbi:MAG: type II toxin-antitoxin system MqsR family toxin [Xanthomonadales bacterium]|nr:type II toxin-antitoxin system MqsR family toxin [Xanthomonadales bacterium]
MVKYALHDIASVIAAAQAGKVHFASTKVEQRTANEGFNHLDVCHCITAISTDTYRTTLQYENSPTAFDVHLCRFRGETIYLKLKLTPSGTVVVLASFHRSEYYA